MRVLHVLSELYPLVKTGGLADVGGSLTLALRDKGLDARVLLPGYPAVMRALGTSRVLFEDSNFFGGGPARILSGALVPPELPAYVVDCPGLFGRGGNPYLDGDKRDWPDNHRRFAALSWAGSLLARGLDAGERPHVVHGHDWQAGLLPAYEALRQGPGGPPVVQTIHNLGYPGGFDASVLSELGLPASAYQVEGVEFYGRLSFLKAGLYYADHITTVSRTYAEEIQSAAQGFGFEGLLSARRDVLSGIVNGIDTSEWNPAEDVHLPAFYTASDLSGKAECKAALQRRSSLAPRPGAPLFGVVSRLAWMKGLDLLPEAIKPALAQGAQLVVLGTGEEELEAQLLALAGQFPGQVAVHIGYDESLAHWIQAGCDALVVPSRTEPCGLTQLCALRYGTLPVVRRTGGLADTVIDATPANFNAGRATGFVFEEADALDLASALLRAVRLFTRPGDWRAVQATAMATDVSWAQAADEYIALYESLLP